MSLPKPAKLKSLVMIALALTASSTAQADDCTRATDKVLGDLNLGTFDHPSGQKKEGFWKSSEQFKNNRANYEANKNRRGKGYDSMRTQFEKDKIKYADISFLVKSQSVSFDSSRILSPAQATYPWVEVFSQGSRATAISIHLSETKVATAILDSSCHYTAAASVGTTYDLVAQNDGEVAKPRAYLAMFTAEYCRAHKGVETCDVLTPFLPPEASKAEVGRHVKGAQEGASLAK